MRMVQTDIDNLILIVKILTAIPKKQTSEHTQVAHSSKAVRSLCGTQLLQAAPRPVSQVRC